MHRILYVGPLSYRGYNSTLSRFKALESMGLDLISLDSTDSIGKNLWICRFNQRTYLSSAVRSANALLRQTARQYHPDVVWIDKGVWIYPWTLRYLHKHARYLIHYNTDDIFARGAHFWLHRLGLKAYDLYLTTNRFNVLEIYRNYGVCTMRVGMGYDYDIYTKLFGIGQSTQTHRSIVFVGHWEPHTEDYITALLNADLPVSVWGAQWEKAKNYALRSTVVLPNSDCVSVIAAADIALCFLSQRNRNESTGRSFEIPAIGTFMLAERTAEHEFIYGDTKGVTLFSNKEELIAKARYYLVHPEKRQSIAAVGHMRCRDLRLSWLDHIKREWPIVERLLTSGDVNMRLEDDHPFWRGFRQGQPFSGESMDVQPGVS